MSASWLLIGMLWIQLCNVHSLEWIRVNVYICMYVWLSACMCHRKMTYVKYVTVIIYILVICSITWQINIHIIYIILVYVILIGSTEQKLCLYRGNRATHFPQLHAQINYCNFIMMNYDTINMGKHTTYISGHDRWIHLQSYVCGRHYFCWHININELNKCLVNAENSF